MDNERKRGQKVVEILRTKGFKEKDLKVALEIMQEDKNKTEKELTSEEKVEKAIEKVVSDIKIPQNLYGYKFLVESLKILLRDPSRGAALEKDVFPKIAVDNNLPGISIKKSVEHVVKIALEKGNQEELNLMFEHKPNYKEFIVDVADRVREELQK